MHPRFQAAAVGTLPKGSLALELRAFVSNDEPNTNNEDNDRSAGLRLEVR